MKQLQDLYADLRNRRLLPVAIALLVAVIAVPLALSRSAKEGTPSGAPASRSTAATSIEPAVAAQAPSLRDSKRLKSFSRKNPFRQHGGGKRESASSSGIVQRVGGGSSGSASAPSVSSAPSAGSTSGSGSSSSPSSSGSSGKTVHVPRPYSHRIDVRVGRVFHTKIKRNVGRLSLLPTQSTPVLSFLGATEGETAAVFMVADGALPKGRGSCRPSKSNCRFLVLKKGETHFLDFRPRGGNLYQIKLIDIDRKYLKRSAKSNSLAKFLRLSS